MSAELKPIAWLRFWAWQGFGSPENGPDNAEGYEVCEPTDKGIDGSDAFPVYATPAPGAPAGFKLVSIEPTPEMCAAAQEQYDYDSRRGTATVASNLYRAMVEAAPGAPGQEAAAVQALAGLLEYCADLNPNQGDEATDDPRIVLSNEEITELGDA